MEQVQRKIWGNQGGGEETKIALFRLGKGGKGEEKGLLSINSPGKPPGKADSYLS